MKKGFTLIEILVSIAILSIVIAGIFAVLNIGDMTWHSDMGLVDLQQQARQAMDSMVREIRQTNTNPVEGNISIVLASEITFSIPPQNYGDAWIGPIRYYLDTQKDQIIREYPTGTTKVLANDINSLNFSLSGNVITIQLSAEKTVRNRVLSFPLTGTLTEQIKLRNE